jgi:hypothetical protein
MPPKRRASKPKSGGAGPLTDFFKRRAHVAAATASAQASVPAGVATKIGVGIEDSGQHTLQEKLVNLKGDLSRTLDKNKTELKQLKDVLAFNKTLSDSYLANLKAVVEMSRMLHVYNDVFEVLRTKFTDLDDELGNGLKQEDFEHIRNLTSDKIAQLNRFFESETKELSKVYKANNRTRELAELEAAMRTHAGAVGDADATYKRIVAQSGVQSAGGALEEDVAVARGRRAAAGGATSLKKKPAVRGRRG